jgi:GNAT superfamily N-acetyltransferase
MGRVRLLTMDDFEAAVTLYRELVGDQVAEGAAGRARFAQLLSLPGTALWGAEYEGALRAMATLHVLPNMTYGGRPYALVENVVTLAAFQGRGLGRRVMEAVIAAAWQADAYKIMLLTGKGTGARGFYEKLGFSTEQKFGMTMRRVPVRVSGKPPED